MTLMLRSSSVQSRGRRRGLHAAGCSDDTALWLAVFRIGSVALRSKVKGPYTVRLLRCETREAASFERERRGQCSCESARAKSLFWISARRCSCVGCGEVLDPLDLCRSI